MSYRITFWGARGSIPTPGAGTARYGGNTPCLTVQNLAGAANPPVIPHAGTGIRPLGNKLMANGQGFQLDLLLSHTHWDHIQGLPFFAPFFVPKHQVKIWGAKQGEVDLEIILRQQMNPVVFPVPLDKLPAD